MSQQLWDGLHKISCWHLCFSINESCVAIFTFWATAAVKILSLKLQISPSKSVKKRKDSEKHFQKQIYLLWVVKWFSPGQLEVPEG